MQFREFQPFARTLPAFNLNDVRKFDPGFHRQQLTDWVNRGYITQLANGYYLLVDTEVDEERALEMISLGCSLEPVRGGAR